MPNDVERAQMLNQLLSASSESWTVQGNAPVDVGLHVLLSELLLAIGDEELVFLAGYADLSGAPADDGVSVARCVVAITSTRVVMSVPGETPHRLRILARRSLQCIDILDAPVLTGAGGRDLEGRRLAVELDYGGHKLELPLPAASPSQEASLWALLPTKLEALGSRR